MRTLITATASAVLGAAFTYAVMDTDHRVEDLTTTLHGQYQINSDYADRIAELQAQLGETPTFYEDGSWTTSTTSGCAPTALCND